MIDKYELKNRLESLSDEDKKLLTNILIINSNFEHNLWTSKGLIREKREKEKQLLISVRNRRNNEIKDAYKYIKKYHQKKWKDILIKVYDSNKRFESLIKAIEILKRNKVI